MQLLINPYGGFGTKTISSLLPDEITNDATPSSAHSTQFNNFHRSNGLRGNYSFDALRRHKPLERFRLHSHAGALTVIDKSGKARKAVISAGMPKSRPWTVISRLCKCLIQATCLALVYRPWIQGHLL